MNNNRPQGFDAGFLSKLFYWSMHLICWTTLALYDNCFKSDIPNTHTLFFIIMVILSNYLYIITTKNPGYVELSQTDLEENNISATLKYCEICQIPQPLRAKHCRICKRCVSKFDHHCFWLGGCIGELNHRLFVLYLTIEFCVLLQLLYYFNDGLSHYNYSYKVNDKIIYSKEYGAYMVLFMVMGAFELFVGGLLIYHMYLISMGETTYESNKRNKISYLRTRKDNPFNEGILVNLKKVCFHGGILHPWTIREVDSIQMNKRKYLDVHICC